MSRNVRRARSVSRRTLSLILVVCIAASMFMGVVFLTGAQNPSKLSELNRSVVVQEINMLPVAPGSGSRTDLAVSSQANKDANNKYVSYADCVDITVNDDESVDLTIKKDTSVNHVAGKNDTAFVEVFTQINQKINLAENPWLMLRWSGSGRANGRLYFSITKNGIEYGSGGKILSNTTDSNKDNDTSLLLSEGFQNWVTGGYLFFVPLNNIVNNESVGYSHVNHTQTDFNAGTVADYSIDLYKYLRAQSAYKSYFPADADWADSSDTYITIYASCQIVASESNTNLTAGTQIHWEKFALGREVMSRPASMLPRSSEFMDVYESNGSTLSDAGRVTKLDDGSVTFMNTSSKTIKFKWNLRRYFNATELEALHINASYTGMLGYVDESDANYDTNINKTWNIETWYGGQTTTYIDGPTYGKYYYRGASKKLQSLVSGYNTSINDFYDSKTNSGTFEAVVDFDEYCKMVDKWMETEGGYKAPYNRFIPDDKLIFIGDVILTLPANAKITFTKLEFQVENEAIPATQADTVYPWASEASPNGLPPVGSPAVSTALNGATGISYDWLAAPEDAPIVKTKIDLLAMKTYHWKLWNHGEKNWLATSSDTTAGVDYTRNIDGSSEYSSVTSSITASDTSYYTVMRYGPTTEENWERNYYTYIDVTDATYKTPYLYYSYELIDTLPNDGIEAEAGFYFHFNNAGRDKYNDRTNNKVEYSYQYYLDHSGIGLNECSSVFSIASSSDDAKYGVKAILSNSKVRTGCIDFSSLYVPGISDKKNNGQYLQLEQLRIYLTKGAKIKINYFFIGSGSLDKSAVGQIANQGGDAVPWAVSKKDFDKWTNPDSSEAKFTYANKIDLFADMQDRATAYNNAHSGNKNAFAGGTLNSDGSVTVTVPTPSNADNAVNKEYLQTAGNSYDYIWRVNVAADGDKSSMRYLNYSVTAPAGMRWSIMFCENTGTTTTDQRAIMTWCDSDARWNDDTIYTSAPAGRSYFRIASYQGYTESGSKTPITNPEYNTYWSGAHNTSWRIYSIPGSQSGCIDMQQVKADFEWNNIISIYLVAYQDPNLELNGQSPSVTFNYLYLTSSPITKSTVGQPATKAGQIYNWGNTKVSQPSAANKLHFSATDGGTYTSWGAVTYELASANKSTAATNKKLYYSYRFVNTTTGTTVDNDGTPLRVGIYVVQNDFSAHYRRNSIGLDSSTCSNIGTPTTTGTYGTYGKSSWVRLNDYSGNDAHKDKDYYAPMLTKAAYYGYASETGVMDYYAYVDNSGNNVVPAAVRFIVDKKYLEQGSDGKYRLKSGYALYVDYLFIGDTLTTEASHSIAAHITLKDAPTPNDYHKAATAGTTVDLDETPYLFYCREYPTGDTGTFSLTMAKGKSTGPETTFFRDASRTDGVLISAGTPNEDGMQYMLQSESGCIDVRDWCLKNGAFEETDSKVIVVSSVDYYGDTGKTHYMYFGPNADKTIDLLPEKTGGRLDNGLPTQTWVVVSSGDVNGPGVSATAKEVEGAQWDTYDDATVGSAKPSNTYVKSLKDQNNDTFNDLNVYSTVWSQVYIRYGNIINTGATWSKTFKYSTSGNNQMSGLMIDLNETPYLHFSIEQPENSKTSIVLQATNNTSNAAMNGQPANKTRPWLSAYVDDSPAGQLMSVLANTSLVTFYKDHIMEGSERSKFTGDRGGVIDLRSWYTETNGYSNVISLDSVRFYTYDNNGNPTDMKVKSFYLSSSASAAYAVTFHSNDDRNMAYTQHVIQNANKQYVSDQAVKDYGFTTREDSVFVGWYTDPTCEQYFDIEGTPLTGNIHLYARWIDESNILKGAEINLLEQMDFDGRTVIGNGYGNAYIDNERLLLEAGSGTTAPLTVKFDVGKAYSVKDFRALFLGFDIDKTNADFDIIVDAKCASSYQYSLIQDVFSPDFLTKNGNLTAAPYDRETAFYTYLGINDDLPTRENKGSLIEINAITIVVPAGVSAEIRYIKAAKELSLVGKSDARAPAVETSFDLLSNTKKDPLFVNKTNNVVYTELASKSLTYQNEEYTQAAVHAVDQGYVHLGGLYDYSINMSKAASAGTGRYLYFSIDQPEDSYVTFALYTSFSGMVEGATAGKRDVAVKDIYTKKAVSYYSSTAKGLASKDYGDATETFMPVQTEYINGSLVGVLDLYTWYSDALVPYRSNSQVDEVKLLGVRIFTSAESTDANINYMFIGTKESTTSSAKFTNFAEYPYRGGVGASSDNSPADAYQYLGGVPRGTTLYVTLDGLTNLYDDAPIQDATKSFDGWVFRDIAVESFAYTYVSQGLATNYDAGVEIAKTKKYTDAELSKYVVYWNPNATNGNMYHPTDNPGGSWYVKNRITNYATGVSYASIDSKIPTNFVTDRKSVFYTFSTNHGNTQIIIPIFSDYQPTLKVTVSGQGSVNEVVGDAVKDSNKVNTWTAAYGTEVVVRASETDFIGWYDHDGMLITTGRDCRVKLVEDTELIARYEGSGTIPALNDLQHVARQGQTIVWLQAADSKVAGSDFYLKAVNGSVITERHDIKSNIDDLTGTSQIICYWNLDDSQMLKAYAPSGYHWEQMFPDGSSMRVSRGNEYLFVASTNVRLLCVKDSAAFESSVMIDASAFDDDRTNTTLRFNGQAICAEGERLLTCGIVFVKYENHGEVPSVGCGTSETVTAKAWNSTTGQFAVEFDVTEKAPCNVRGYAIFQKADGTKQIVYSDYIASVF